ncbi:hypothetical protein FNF29_01443 [Cafeteria roenbergensis]|uniref:Tr-type G domain-containing protein n=1 Tax=Cafeteria roenbergensis TaxID=33653 RepID=A0A5A8CSC7_CAFRO|nr:hypothetical protein FNF29_01443 [Cafeteria roenbergensis]|eukprot:KAA0156025.1 hypothetical protein FNF29_01443 [Cafeteria roenbergensis]
MATRISSDRLRKLQSATPHLRTLCILAHVDHGKTTLTDSLISSNGIISDKLAGKIRYMDSLEEEQRRGITMKSSAIALLHYGKPWRNARRGLLAKLEAAELAASPGMGADAARAAAKAKLPPSVPYLLHLVDTPGHVDFSADVATAARLCDGAFLVVDAAEGVCIQTQAVLRTAYAEGLRVCLVLNKVDRLITELRLTPREAFDRLSRTLEAVNAFAASLYAAERFAEAAAADEDDEDDEAAAAPGAPEAPQSKSAVASDAAAVKGPSGAHHVAIDERRERSLLFDPARGNVVFASAAHGWAFSTADFAEWWSPRLGLPAKRVREGLWGEFQFSKRDGGRIKPAKVGAGSTSIMAVELMLAPVWKVYETAGIGDPAYGAGGVPPGRGTSTSATVAAAAAAAAAEGERVAKKLCKMAGRLGIELDPKLVGPRVSADDRAPAFMRAWLPLAPCVLSVAERHLPCPREAGPLRAAKLVPRTPPGATPALAAALARCRAAIASADPSPDAPVLAYASKIFAVSATDITPHPQALPVRKGMPVGAFDGVSLSFDPAGAAGGSAAEAAPGAGAAEGAAAAAAGPEEDDEADEALPAAARGSAAMPGPVFPANVDDVGQCSSAGGFTSAPAQVGGSSGGGGGGGGGVAGETLMAFLRVFSGTLTSSSPVIVLGPRYDPASDPGRFARDPRKAGAALLGEGSLGGSSQMGGGDGEGGFDARGSSAAAGSRGSAAGPPSIMEPRHSLPLFLMMARDLQPVTAVPAGNVAAVATLERCIIKTATISSFVCAAPLASLTVQTTPLVSVSVEARDPTHTSAVETGLRLLQQGDPCVDVEVTAKGELLLACLGPLHLERCLSDLRERFCRGVALVAAEEVAAEEEADAADDADAAAVAAAGAEEAAAGAAGTATSDDAGDAAAAVCSAAELFGAASLTSLLGSLQQGFRLASSAGPLCGEPVWGVAYLLSEVMLKLPPGSLSGSASGSAGALRLPGSGNVMATARVACEHAIRRAPMRIVEGWLRCQLTCSSGRSGGGEHMGNLYGVLARRRGRVVDERMLEGTSTFLVEAILPMTAAAGFAEALRGATSGAATSPQMVFSHWEAIDEDPFFRPKTASELEEFGDTVHAGQQRNTARELVKEVRRRKGLDLDRRIVVAAEKQRTLARKR